MNYDVNYFIAKFEAIPSRQIGSGSLSKHCALWHCGVREKTTRYVMTAEAAAMDRLLGGDGWGSRIVNVNDCGPRLLTPRARILAALRDIKAKGAA